VTPSRRSCRVKSCVGGNSGHVAASYGVRFEPPAGHGGGIRSEAVHLELEVVREPEEHLSMEVLALVEGEDPAVANEPREVARQAAEVGWTGPGHREQIAEVARRRKDTRRVRARELEVEHALPG